MRRLQLATSIPLALCALWVIISEFRLPPESQIFRVPPVDLLVYKLAAISLNSEGNLYDGDFVPGLPFTYPPFAGVVFRPLPLFADLPLTIAWQLLNFAAMFLVVWLIYRASLPAFLLSIAAIGLDAVHGGFYFGQINLLLMLLVALDFLPKNRRFAGIGVGLAAGLKLTPAFFVLIFIIERRWRAAVASAVTFIATVVIGWLFVPDATRFWTSAITDSSRVGVHDNPGAQSLRSVMERVLNMEQWWLVAVVVTLLLVVLGIMVAVRSNDMAWAMVIAGIGACLVSPFTWFHHWVWMVPLAAVLMRGFHRRPLTQVACVIGTVVLLLPHLSAAVSPYTVSSLSAEDVWFITVGYVAIVGYIIIAGTRRLRTS
ncbi:putative DUF2029 family protein [Corynebacterium mustelae]|uniref:Putative DUF2029 family protein n=1 Tax=Corynebacterium mustelae TaxID=571915 RepID=A0A0G3H749_9CORY|nr:glycosyltransferase 87 family protein [Corynebacterium mustelae]AKK06992.1 putative DUF2029 family protein [Corynebacterium mustelae]